VVVVAVFSLASHLPAASSSSSSSSSSPLRLRGAPGAIGGGDVDVTGGSGMVSGLGGSGGHYPTDGAPVICILSQPAPPALTNRGYVAASYVKYVEMAGGLAAALKFDDTAENRKKTLDKCNGVLIPGGEQTLEQGQPFYDAAVQAMEYAVKQTQAGNPMPVHGTCLGFETMCVYLAGNDGNLLKQFDAQDDASTLTLTRDARNSTLFRQFDDAMLASLERHAFTMENHVQGVPPSAFDDKLTDKMRILSVSDDKQGNKYVSSIDGVPDGKYAEFTAVQWHPEKNAFEFNNEQHIPHGLAPDEVTFRMAQAFVDRCRRNGNRAATQQEAMDVLIYNYNVRFMAREAPPGGVEANFFQVYDI